jgi:hypothetical protein
VENKKGLQVIDFLATPRYFKWRRHPDLNRRITVLQTAALPLGYAAIKKVERETGFEPATSTLARLHSTTELFPLANFYITARAVDVKEK